MFHAFLAFLLLLLPTRAALSREAAAQQQAPPSTGSNAAAANPSPSPTGDASSKKEKKVWTNENLGDAKGTVSVVGGKDGVKPKGHPAKSADAAYGSRRKEQTGEDEKRYRLRRQTDCETEEFNAGEPVGTSDREFHKGYNMQPVDQQIQRLEEKKRDLQGKIDALLDEARKKGVEPGQLR